MIRGILRPEIEVRPKSIMVGETSFIFDPISETWKTEAGEPTEIISFEKFLTFYKK